MEAPLIPFFPPVWAEVFGEDRHGVFAAFTLKGVEFVWRWIPRGRFRMGSPEDETGRWDDEGPQHEVTLTQGFWMGETPVTQAQWMALMGENPSQFQGERRPVERVTWREGVAFAAQLSEAVPGLSATLPTEAQWEYACRAGTTGAFHDGSACTVPGGKDPALERLGWYGENSGGQTHDVKEKRPNAWGLYDMHGNVWEWCRDGWSSYGAEEVVDPEHDPAEDGANRVVRGGSWIDRARDCRAAFRSLRDPGFRDYFRGFRLAAGQEL
ncbi:MAG: formylglycine-generating enzyme family protein [Verrucomicrobiae bacterium]|nr:formylglycine-generating enzyme family protein [Verrucomicrobiae bacterium]